MEKIWIFGGTIEGRKLAEYLSGESVEVYLSVATKYGQDILKDYSENHDSQLSNIRFEDNIHVQVRRMESSDMIDFINENQINLVIDATHPYATIVTKNIQMACNKCNTFYIRVERAGINCYDKTIKFSDLDSAISYLNTTTGNILITTGSKELMKYTSLDDYQNRCYPRVLPSLESIDICKSLGFESKNICCMQGPFSAEFNYEQIQMIKAKYVVTKASGKNGGFEEKYQAALKAGAMLVVIERPEKALLDTRESAKKSDTDKIINETIDEKQKTIKIGYEISNESQLDNEKPKCLDELWLKESNLKVLSLSESMLYLKDKYQIKKKQKVTLLGIGMGTKSSLTLEAKSSLENADVVIGAKRMVDLAKEIMPSVECFQSYKNNEIISFIGQHPEYMNIVIALSGDIGFCSGAKAFLNSFDEISQKQDDYSFTSYICKTEFESVCKEKAIDKDSYIKEVSSALQPKAKQLELIVNMISGISSPVYFLNKIGVFWEDVLLLSNHGKALDIVGKVRANQKIFILLGKMTDVSEICSKLIAYNLNNVEITIGENLSYPNEKIERGKPKDFIDKIYENLAVIYIENKTPRRYYMGMNDELFIRAKVPMTKCEVRSLSLQKLQLNVDSVFYDVGAGTGSVSIEAAMICTEGNVYAIEKNEKAVDLISQNKQKFQIDNCTIVQGAAPKCLENLERPTHAFIGGSGGNLEDIIRLLLGKNPQIIIVINIISLDTLSEVMRLVKEGIISEPELVQVQVSKSRKVATHHMMEANNPIYIVTIKPD